MEAVDLKLDRLISKRASQDRREDPDEQEEIWKARVRAYTACQREQMRAACASYHAEQAERHRAVLEALISNHEAKACELLGDEDRGRG